MRRGDHVVKGTLKVTQPGNAKKISDNEFEFPDRKSAEAYAKGNELHTTLKKIWVDKEPPKGCLDDEITGEQRKVLASDTDSVARYRATVQNRHVGVSCRATGPRASAPPNWLPKAWTCTRWCRTGRSRWPGQRRPERLAGVAGEQAEEL